MPMKPAPKLYHLLMMSIWHNKWVFFTAIISAVAGVWYLGNTWGWSALHGGKSVSVLSFTLTILTFATASFLGLRGFLQDWEKSLPKKLTVSFIYRGQEVMRCDNAYLAHEGDIRNWGQQIGGQMAAATLGKRVVLNFNPDIEHTQGRVRKDEHGAYFVHYSAKFYLIDLPPRVIKLKMDGQKGPPYIHWSVLAQNVVSKHPETPINSEK